MAQVRDFSGNFSGSTDDAPLVSVAVGDTVGFKSDHEQYGKVVEIIGSRLRLRNENGFGGEYLRYAKETIEDASRCWKD